MKLMRLITIKIISIIISTVNDACTLESCRLALDNFSMPFQQSFEGRWSISSLHVVRRYLTERESSAWRTFAAHKNKNTGRRWIPFQYYTKKLFSILVFLRHSMLSAVVEGVGRKSFFFMIPVVQIVNRDRAPTNVRYFLRVYNVFSVCYLFDVSLSSEFYWHLGDITMNMTFWLKFRCGSVDWKAKQEAWGMPQIRWVLCALKILKVTAVCVSWPFATQNKVHCE